MKPDRAYAVMLHPDAPKVFLEMLKLYVQVHQPVSFLVASRAESNGHFLDAELFGKDNTADSLKIQIPISYVLAIVEIYKDKKMRPGFLQEQ